MGVLRNGSIRSRCGIGVRAGFLLVLLRLTAADAQVHVDHLPRVLILYPYDERIAANHRCR